MKNNRKIVKQYMPWLLLFLCMDGFAALLLWLADVEAFRALVAVILLATLFLFGAVSGGLALLERRREAAFRDFLDTPDEYHEKLLLRVAGEARGEAISRLGALLREKQSAYHGLQGQLRDYEEYVEAWAHEAKIPLSLLMMLLDNRRDELPEQVEYKLDYIRNRMQECIDQMLFYARVKGARKDYLFEYLSVKSCVEEVVEEYFPLLEEKRFKIIGLEEDGSVYTDRRGIRFLLQQVVSNAVKYSGEDPELCFAFERGERVSVLYVRDNGQGVPACDLPYIFEKGFTGDSGEDRKKATGMGLYLAKEIAKDLKLTLEAVSGRGKGFEMRIAFPVVVPSPERR